MAQQLPVCSAVSAAPVPRQHDFNVVFADGSCLDITCATACSSDVACAVLLALRMRPSQLKLVLIQSGMLLGPDAIADSMLPVTVVKMAPVPHPDVEEPWVARWDADSERFWFELEGLRLSQWEMPSESERGWFCGRDRDSNEFVWRQLSTGETSDRCPPLAPAPWSTVWDADMDAFFFERDGPGGFVSIWDHPPATPLGWECSWSVDADQFVFFHVDSGRCFWELDVPVLQGLSLLPVESLSAVDVKSAYKRASVRLHPDKGGDAAFFTAVKSHFEAVLGKLADMTASCGSAWVPVWDPDARCFAWRDIATGARAFYEAEVAPGDATATGVCEAGAGVRSDDVGVVARLALALSSSVDAHACDNDAGSDAELDALDEVVCAEDVLLDTVFLSFDAKRALFEAPVPDNDDDDGGDDGDDDDDFVDTQRDLSSCPCPSWTVPRLRSISLSSLKSTSCACVFTMNLG